MSAVREGANWMLSTKSAGRFATALDLLEIPISISLNRGYR